MSYRKLDQALTLLQKNVSRDAMGGEILTWEEVITIPANARPIQGREFIALLQTESALSVVFTIRYRTDITAAWRVMWRSVQYELIGPPVPIDGGKEWLEINCTTAQT